MVINTPFRELSCLLSIHHQSRVKKKAERPGEGGGGVEKRSPTALLPSMFYTGKQFVPAMTQKNTATAVKTTYYFLAIDRKHSSLFLPSDNPVAITIIPSGITTKESLGRGEIRIDVVVKEEAENCGLKGGQMGRVNSHPACKTEHWSGETTYKKKHTTDTVLD